MSALQFDREKVNALLRYGRKHSGWWDDPECGQPDGLCPDDSHTDLVTAAPDLLVACRNAMLRLERLDYEFWQAEIDECRAAIAKAEGKVPLPHPSECEPVKPLADLVARFAAALLEKLEAAERKHGHGDAWQKDGWREDLLRSLAEHIRKGDPRDVAAYCAFAWHHGWSVGECEPARESDERLVVRALAKGEDFCLMEPRHRYFTILRRRFDCLYDAQGVPLLTDDIRTALTRALEGV